MADRITEALEQLAPVSLSELDERAALLRRVDNKHLRPSVLHRSHRGARPAFQSGSERLTCDLGVRLSSPGKRAAELRPELVLVETKTEHGDSPADRELRRRGIEPISLSKYRVGTGLFGDVSSNDPQPGSELFETAPDE